MAIMWNGSLIPWIDENGDPYAGAKAYFFDAGATTPKVTYTTSDLSIPHDHPVVANASGMFPAIFMAEQDIYRLRITSADDVTIWDINGISSPTTQVPEPPTSNTETQYLYQTGDLKFAWRSASPTGYVRCNGRTIGAATSGATERANADCEDLFKFLWEQDSNLDVSGGRGSTSAGDWSAAKRIALPDFRGMTPVGMLGMGNTAVTTIPASLIDSGDGDGLGDKGGVAEVTLTAAQVPELTGTAAAAGAHSHTGGKGGTSKADDGSDANGPNFWRGDAANTGSVPDHTHAVTVNSDGGGSHSNLQPSLFVPVFIKL